MFKAILEFLKRRIERNRERRYNSEFHNGFGWCMSAFFLENKTPMEIESFYSVSPFDGEQSPFDKGAEKAMDVLVERGIVKSNELYFHGGMELYTGGR